MKIGRGNRSTRRKPAQAPLCPLLFLNSKRLLKHVLNCEQHFSYFDPD
jgi:hypothetical protein